MINEPLQVTALLEGPAFDWMKANAIAMPGDVVETLWGGWKKPRRVRINAVGCHVICRYQKGGPGHYGFRMELEMTYTAYRIRKDGTSAERNGAGGICLRNLITVDGRSWAQGAGNDRSDLNHAGLCFELARAR